MVLMKKVELEELIGSIGSSHETLISRGLLPDWQLIEMYEGRDRLGFKPELGINMDFWRETKKLETLFITLRKTTPSTFAYQGELPAPYVREMTQADVHAIFGEPMVSKGPIKMPLPIGQTGGWESYQLDPERYFGKKVVFQYGVDMKVNTLVFTLLDTGHS